jgi:hypothetical protein
MNMYFRLHTIADIKEHLKLNDEQITDIAVIPKLGEVHDYLNQHAHISVSIFTVIHIVNVVKKELIPVDLI